MDKFKISQVRDYFLKTNENNESFTKLSPEQLVGMAVLSIFDKSGKTIKTASVEYVRPDGIIDKNEFNISKSDYEKMVKDINKELKKETGKDIGTLKIPTYEDLQAMMKNDGKIDMQELREFSQAGIVREQSAEKPKPVQIPEKTTDSGLTLEQKQEFITKAFSDPEKDAILERVEAKLDAAEKAGTKAYDFSAHEGEISAIEGEINDFKPDDDISYNIQAGLDGLQFNSKGQRVTRINNTAGFYEKYTYDSSEQNAKYSKMVRYNGLGYKTDYFKRMQLTDKNGKAFEGVVIYHLDDHEKLCRITYPADAAEVPFVSDFNDYKLYERVTRYYEELGKAGKLAE